MVFGSPCNAWTKYLNNSQHSWQVVDRDKGKGEDWGDQWPVAAVHHKHSRVSAGWYLGHRHNDVPRRRAVLRAGKAGRDKAAILETELTWYDTSIVLG